MNAVRSRVEASGSRNAVGRGVGDVERVVVAPECEPGRAHDQRGGVGVLGEARGDHDGPGCHRKTVAVMGKAHPDPHDGAAVDDGAASSDRAVEDIGDEQVRAVVVFGRGHVPGPVDALASDRLLHPSVTVQDQKAACLRRGSGAVSGRQAADYHPTRGQHSQRGRQTDTTWAATGQMRRVDPGEQ